VLKGVVIGNVVFLDGDDFTTRTLAPKPIPISLSWTPYSALTAFTNIVSCNR